MTARLLLAHGHFEVARQLAVEGRIRYPESPDLFVVLGLLSEWRAGLGLDAGDLRGFTVRGELYDRALASSSTPYRGNAGHDLQTAAAEYRRAIAIDPGACGRAASAGVGPLADGRPSRVGRRVAGVHRGRERRSAIPGAPASRHGRRAREKRTVGACRIHGRAVARPRFSNGVSCGEQRAALNGQLGEARGTAAECLKPGTGAPAVDSWTLFRLGLMDATTTEGLREEARRP